MTILRPRCLKDDLIDIVTDALNSAVPEPWEVADQAANRILERLTTAVPAQKLEGEVRAVVEWVVGRASINGLNEAVKQLVALFEAQRLEVERILVIADQRYEREITQDPFDSGFIALKHFTDAVRVALDTYRSTNDAG